MESTGCKLSDSNSQIQEEALAIYCAVQRLHKPFQYEIQDHIEPHAIAVSAQPAPDSQQAYFHDDPALVSPALRE